MIELKTYKTTDSANVLNKTLTETGDYEGVLNAEFNILRPVIRFRTNTPVTFNYAYIPQLQRYYFVDNVKQDGNLCVVSLKVDVLYTYREQIKNLNATLVESGTPDKYVSTRTQVYDVRPKIRKLAFPNTGLLNETGNIIMITIKGTK